VQPRPQAPVARLERTKKRHCASVTPCSATKTWINTVNYQGLKAPAFCQRIFCHRTKKRPIFAAAKIGRQKGAQSPGRRLPWRAIRMPSGIRHVHFARAKCIRHRAKLDADARVLTLCSAIFRRTEKCAHLRLQRKLGSRGRAHPGS